MQVSGRLIILAAFALAIVMSGGAWLYHYSQVRQIAAFWGHPAGRLLVRGPEVTFFELGEIGDEPSAIGVLAGRPIESQTDLSAKEGLVHLRHVFYYDANFTWKDRRREPVNATDWAYAVRFAEGDQELFVLLRDDFARVGKLAGDQVDALPAPRIADSVQEYLTDIGVINREAAPR
ncbi:MAG TPA: hypothetical protein VF175_01450 [Lacipirellula sp.]